MIGERNYQKILSAQAIARKSRRKGSEFSLYFSLFFKGQAAVNLIKPSLEQDAPDANPSHLRLKRTNYPIAPSPGTCRSGRWAVSFVGLKIAFGGLANQADLRSARRPFFLFM
jgi:hypothetical protein